MALSDLNTSQLGTAQLGFLQLGMVSSESLPPPSAAPDMSTWYIAMSHPEPIITEVIAY